MMIMHNPLLWVLVGVISALLFLKSLEWSVGYIHPERRRKSIRLIIGGTLIRWALFSLVLVYSLLHSTLAGLIVFGTFLVLRFIFLLKWQGWLRSIH